MPPAEPTPADVAAVAAHIGEAPAPQPTAQPVAAPPAAPAPQPQPQPQPAPQMQPAQPTPQPAPTQAQTDPFEQLFTPLPTEPAATPTQQPAPQPTPQPETPVEPGVPAPQAQPAPQPQAPAAPAAPAIPGQSAPGEQQYQTFEEYMNSVTAGLPAAPTVPDPSTINPDDPAAIKGFFDELLSSAEKRFEANYERKQAIQNTEKKLWDGAFSKYPSLRDNKKARDLVHSIRMGHFQRGQAITPTQAAEILLDSMGQQYRQGVADSSVVTTIEQVQPQGGGTGQPVPTTLDKESVLTAVQTGGETALAAYLDGEIKAGRMPG